MESDYLAHLLAWYGKLSTRRVDLVGDYAGSELFIVEGDSLLLRCFENPDLDFDGGFQLLHAVYEVEAFLQNLRQRRCNFHLVFFNSNERLCIPPNTSAKKKSKYLLARAVIYHHLMDFLIKPSQSSIQLHSFTSIADPLFKEYLSSAGVYFVMCHDGASMSQEFQYIGKDEDNVDLKHFVEDDEHQSKAIFRGMILSLLNEGYNVALINGLTWQDTKVMSEVVEGHRITKLSLQLPASGFSSTHYADLISKFGSLDGLANLTLDNHDAADFDALFLAIKNGKYSCRCDSLRSFDPEQWTQRRFILVFALKKLLARDAIMQDIATIFVWHIVMLELLPLKRRRFGSIESTDVSVPRLEIFLNEILRILLDLLKVDKSSQWPKKDAFCDIADLLDARLLMAVATTLLSGGTFDFGATSRFEEIANALCLISGIHLEAWAKGEPQSLSRDVPIRSFNKKQITVLPFSNPVFDKHLAPVQLTIAPTKANSFETGRIFREVTHWHNAKRQIVSKRVAPLSGRDKMRLARRTDNFMADMRTYAASLTNATGKSLEPEIVTVGKADTASNTASQPNHQKPHTKGKTTKKQKRLEELTTLKLLNERENAERVASAWRKVRTDLEGERSLVSKYHKIAAYFRSLPKHKGDSISAEIQYHLVCVLVDIYRVMLKKKDTPVLYSEELLSIRALLWDMTRRLHSLPGFTKTIAVRIQDLIKRFRFPEMEFETSLDDRKLAYDPGLSFPKGEELTISINNRDFQLLYCGPYMDRNLDSAPDNRVPFEPDGWQRKVLDGLDANHSLFVVAPTSSGKTFISFYAMEKILRSNDESILVYVAPTKALVNQIAAEVQARLSKKYKHPGKSVWAIHTRDYRINNPVGCQILVTVPHILQIMLLAPSNAKTWSSRVRYIIFDEVHSIGQAEDGVVWEQLLLLAPCPIIALSATVGNPTNFSSWLSDTQKELGNTLTTVQHNHRYSDLRKFIYHPPKSFDFHGLTDRLSFGVLGLDNVDGLEYVHPLASLVNKSRGLPPDLSLEARDCLLLYEAMDKHQTKDYPVDLSLKPENSLKVSILRKVDIIEWEESLKALLRQWQADDESPFDAVIADLSKPSVQTQASRKQFSREKDNSEMKENLNSPTIQSTVVDLYQTTLPLICKLHERNALPAIFFNYDRSKCEGICRAVTKQLEAAEEEWKQLSPTWKAKLNGFETYKKEKAKLTSKKVPKASKKKGRSDEDTNGDRLLDTINENIDPYAGFDPEDPIDGYHFVGRQNADATEMSAYFRELKRRGIPEWLLAGLKRGVGIHHAGMNRKYRQIVEILFRKGYLRVVIATGTLALGINMPCATVVFSGDSVFLTALNFRQAAGRAGRRGFDLLGNVVFQGISRGKVYRLLSSRLPDLNGHFPITTTLILRLFTLLHDSNRSVYAVQAINSLLSQPRLYLDGAAFRDQVLHHLRFSIEYLRRQDLLSASGAPINFAGLTSHLYFTENSSFALNALIKNGYLHDLCANINSCESSVLRTLMLVLAHLFHRHPCRQADAEYLEKVKRSSSIVFLPPLPVNAAKVLSRHNQDTLQIFANYVGTFVDQHMAGKEDSTLPFTRIEMGGASETIWLSQSQPSTKIRSAFVALSGHGDNFATVSDLCRTVRGGVFLEEAVIPYIDLHPQESKTPLNAYLYDFFMHGDIEALERANGVRKADVWFLLNDFSLVLATIVASLANFLKLPESDISLEDLAGEGDEYDNLEDDKFADDSTESSEATGVSAATTNTNQTSLSASSALSRPEKEEVADNWDDATDEKDVKPGEKIMNAQNSLPKEDLETGFLNIYKAFVKLRTEFDTKFRKIFA